MNRTVADTIEALRRFPQNARVTLSMGARVTLNLEDAHPDNGRIVFEIHCPTKSLPPHLRKACE